MNANRNNELDKESEDIELISLSRKSEREPFKTPFNYLKPRCRVPSEIYSEIDVDKSYSSKRSECSEENEFAKPPPMFRCKYCDK